MLQMGRHGENIRKRKDGRWEARLPQGHDSSGQTIYRYFYGKSYAEAKAKRNKALEESTVNRTNPKSDLRFGQLAQEWLDAKRGSVEESTYATYANLLDKHLLPQLGTTLLSFLNKQELDRFLLEKRFRGHLDGSGGLSDKSVSDIRAVLNMIIQYAQSRGIRSLTGIHLTAAAARQSKVQALTRQEQILLEEQLFSRSDPLHLGILLSLYAGLRIGEVCALQWGDFHFDNGTVAVNKTLLRIRNMGPETKTRTKLVIDNPKTQCSNRIIPLPEFLVPYFQEQRRAPEVYVPTGKQHFMEPRACLARYKRVLRLAGVQSYTFHTLRHTFATRCVENGVDIKSLSEIMGHSNVTVTMQRYVHPSMDLKREQMNKLAAVTIHGQSSSQPEPRVLG